MKRLAVLAVAPLVALTVTGTAAAAGPTAATAATASKAGPPDLVVSAVSNPPGAQLGNTYELEQGWPDNLKMHVAATPLDPDLDNCEYKPDYTEFGPPVSLGVEIIPFEGLTPNLQHTDGWNLAGSASHNFPQLRYRATWTLTPVFS